MHAAIYARVSTERQERDQTIDSQLAALRTWVQQQGYALLPEHLFTDEGYSGARLDRPGLDRLRDAAREGGFTVVAILSPDRLARKYAYQVLLLEEFRRLGCPVVFLQHPISDDPNDQLLLQIQGAIAEYERAVLAERFRRGRLQQARAGHYQGGKAPYGYRYLPKQESCPGHLVVDETEAAVVRTLFRWVIEEHLTLRQLLKRLKDSPWRPRSGTPHWSVSTVHHILTDPVCVGTAYANRYDHVPPRKPRRPGGPGSTANTCRQLKPPEEWIAIPVPALIDQATYDLAQAQLARNRVLSFRHAARHAYLLRCLLTCGTCGLAMHGITYPATATRPEHRYYRCAGRDPILRGRPERCPHRAVKAEELETTVWRHIAGLLSDPGQLLAQFQRLTELSLAGDQQEQAEAQQLEVRIQRLGREESRLLDAYQAGVLSLDELAQRRPLLEQRRRALVAQREQQGRLRQERARGQAVLMELTTFCERIRARLSEASFEDRQAILQLLIERVIVGDDTLEIRHVIPLSSLPPGASGPDAPDARLRSDGVGITQRPPLGREPLVRGPAV
jgi:site-specific DNA recombinase